VQPDAYPRADEFGELRFELFWHETTINPPLNIDHRQFSTSGKYRAAAIVGVRIPHQTPCPTFGGSS
jgi:hypothetical protein